MTSQGLFSTSIEEGRILCGLLVRAWPSNVTCKFKSTLDPHKQVGLVGTQMSGVVKAVYVLLQLKVT